MNDESAPRGQVLVYSDGGFNLQVRLDGQTVWLTQAQMAELYQTTPQNITLHIQGIYDDGELPEAATCKEYLQVRQEGSHQVQRTLKHYSLDMILAVGYRVRSPRGTLFRQWATTRLRELLVKSFTMNGQTNVTTVRCKEVIGPVIRRFTRNMVSPKTNLITSI